MIIRLNEVRLLNFLRICDRLCIKVSPEEVELIGEKSNSRIISRYTEEGPFEVLAEEEYVLGKDAVVLLETFIKTLHSKKKSDYIEFNIDESMPDIIIKKNKSGIDEFNQASVSIPIDFETDIFDNLDINFAIKEEDIVVLNRSFLETMNRAGKFVDYKSELKPAQYISLDIDAKNSSMNALGFTGISGYEEKSVLQQEISMMSMTNSGTDMKMFVHATVLNELYRQRTMLNNNNISLSSTLDNKYYSINDGNYTIYLKKDDVKEVDFAKLFNQEFDIILKEIPVLLLEQALSTIPGASRADGIVKISIDNNSVLIGDNNVKFQIATLIEAVEMNNLYFNGRDISNYLKNVKKTGATTVALCLKEDNKILRFSSSSNVSDTRFIVIGLNYDNDEEVFM